jgi:hypothetical protein
MLFQILEELNLTMDQFIDLCILSGCDYCDSIRGIWDFHLQYSPCNKYYIDIFFLISINIILMCILKF